MIPMKQVAFVFLATLLLSACVSVPDNLTVRGKAYAHLIQTEQYVTDVALTAKDLRDVGIIVAGSGTDAQIKQALINMQKRLNDAWSLFHASDFAGAVDGSKSARAIYLQLRKQLLELQK